MIKLITCIILVFTIQSCTTSKRQDNDISKPSNSSIISPKDLYVAVENNNIEQAKFCIDNGLHLDFVDDNGLSTLIIAIKNKNYNMSKLLIDNDINLDHASEEGWTPLIYSIYYSQFNIVKLLVGKDIDVNLKTKIMATPIFYSIIHNEIKTAKYLIDHGANINIKDHLGWTPLMLSLMKEQSEFAEYLIELGAEINVTSNNNKHSPISISADKKLYNLLEYFLQRKEILSIKEKNAIAWLYATDRIKKYDLEEALNYILDVNNQTNFTDAIFLDTLAVVYAALEDWDEAIKYQMLAIELTNNENMSKEFSKRLGLFQNRKKFYTN